MTDCLLSAFQHLINWPFWEHFRLVQATPPATGSIFGFAEYLASLALFLVVMTASDFRYRYRLALNKRDLRKAGLWIGFGIGAALLLIDVWFQNGLPIPKIIANSNNLKAALAIMFLMYLFRVISVAVIRPPSFTRANSKRFFDVNYHLIHEGNPDRLQVIAEELRRPLKEIVTLAAKIPKSRGEIDKTERLQGRDYAINFLLLIGHKRFCEVVVARVPTFASICFEEAQKFPRHRLPIFQFVRNIGQEFIRNTKSSFYQEESGYDTGLVGYTRSITSIVYGSYEFIEQCAAEGGSPLDTDYRDFYEFNGTQMEGYSRASLVFLESYLKATEGQSHHHSYALVRMLHSFEGSLSSVYQINGLEDYRKTPAYGRLCATVHFIESAIDLVDKYAAKPSNFRVLDKWGGDIFDKLAHLAFDTIFAASTVSSPVWTAWAIQHNAVWGQLFGLRRSYANKIIAFKVRRLVYDEIMRMGQFANFKGARILGYCLNVHGLKLINRHTGYQKEFYPLQASALSWVQTNYKRLLADHPKVAEACLQGSVSYDADKHRLVKTYSGETGKVPNREYLELD